MSTLFQGPEYQAFDGNGDPLAGGSVEFFEVGTSTPKDVYSDASLSTTLGSTVTLDGEGRCKLWLNGDYKVRLKKSDGTIVRTTDSVNPALETETSSGNLVANGSFEDAGNSSTEADGWTLAAQSDGAVERVTSDNYHGEAALKFTSDGSGGGQADTEAFFLVSPGRTYEVSFFLKCSVSNIRNIVQVRYFDKDQQFLSNSTVYDEDTSNPTSWTLKTFEETPPANARFGKLRILGADQSDATPGEAKFDEITVRTIRADSVSTVFPNVNDTVTVSDEELDKLAGYPGDIPRAGWVLLDSKTAGGDSNLDFTGIDGTYFRYMFVFGGVYSSETTKVYARFTTDGGVNWIDGASDYWWWLLNESGTASSDASDDKVLIADSIVSANRTKGEVMLTNIGGGGLSSDLASLATDMHISSSRDWVVGGLSGNTDQIDGVRFLLGAGTFDGGTVYLYGWRSGA